MAEQIFGLGLNAVPVAAEHGHKVWNPMKHKYDKARGKVPRPDPDTRDHRTMEEKGYELRKRNQVGSDEEIVDVVRHRGQVVPRKPRNRPGMNRRSSSMGDARDNGYRGGGGGYESEGSVPPRSRTRAKSQGGSGWRRSSSSSSTSSSDLGSSTDEEKQLKHMQRKKWITAGLASVATIHAASKVYSSIEAHDKRILAVQAGEISPEEAHKKQRAARWQDAAAIAIAALGIKGAMSEWNEVQEEHKEHKELMEKKEQNHKRRLEHQRRHKARERGGYYKGHDGNWYYDGSAGQNSDKRQQLDGPRNGDRKLIEGPDRSRGGYYDDGYYDDAYNDGRSRSQYGRSRSLGRSETNNGGRSRSGKRRKHNRQNELEKQKQRQPSSSDKQGNNNNSKTTYQRPKGVGGDLLQDVVAEIIEFQQGLPL